MSSMPKKGLTYLQAAAIVLRNNGPMKAPEIVREIQKRQLMETDLEDKDTPGNTINARISEDIDRYGKESVFVRSAPGSYALREEFEGPEYIVRPRQSRSLLSEVLVFPSELLDKVGRFHGIRQDYELYVDQFLNLNNSLFMPRLQAEDTEDYKQVISYVIIKHNDSLLRFVRGKITTVYRYLYGEYSLGFGGHVEKGDWNLFSFTDNGFLESIRRELNEEIGIDLDTCPTRDINLQFIGVLNDDSSPLGRRHFAFLLLLEFHSEHFRMGIEFNKGEKSVNDLRLVDIPSLSTDFPGYEYWSKLVIQTFFSERLATVCHIESTQKFRLNKYTTYLLIVGFVGSGKSEACRMLADSFGYTLVPCSSIMRELIGCGPIEEVGRKKLQDAGLELVSAPNGHERLAQAIVSFMKNSEGKKFVLDGLRYPETLESLEKQFGENFTTIYIETTIDQLYKNYQEREGGIYTFEEYVNLVDHPVERTVERFVHLADIVIYNHGSWASYMEVLKEFFTDLLQQK